MTNNPYNHLRVVLLDVTLINLFDKLPVNVGVIS